MKLTTLLLSALAACATAASGASLTLSNITTGAGDDLALLDNAGNGITADSGAFIAAYVFPGGAPADFSALRANGEAGLLASIGLSAGNVFDPGAFFTQVQFPNPGPPNGAGELDGQNIYLVVGNNMNTATSSQLALLSTGVSTNGSDNPLPNDLSYTLTGSSTVLIGVVDQTTVDWSNANGETQYTTAALRLVPEPSSTLLFGLAGLTLLIRRRR